MDISLPVPAKSALCKYVRLRSRPGLKCRSYNFLGVTHAIHGCGIDPVHTELKRTMDCCNRRFIVLFAPAELPARATDGPSAEADGCEGQIGVTKTLRFHVRL